MLELQSSKVQKFNSNVALLLLTIIPKGACRREHKEDTDIKCRTSSPDVIPPGGGGLRRFKSLPPPKIDFFEKFRKRDRKAKQVMCVCGGGGVPLKLTYF